MCISAYAQGLPHVLIMPALCRAQLPPHSMSLPPTRTLRSWQHQSRIPGLRAKQQTNGLCGLKYGQGFRSHLEEVTKALARPADVDRAALHVLRQTLHGTAAASVAGYMAVYTQAHLCTIHMFFYVAHKYSFILHIISTQCCVRARQIIKQQVYLRGQSSLPHAPCLLHN